MDASQYMGTGLSLHFREDSTKGPSFFSISACSMARMRLLSLLLYHSAIPRAVVKPVLLSYSGGDTDLLQEQWVCAGQQGAARSSRVGELGLAAHCP